MPPTFGRGQHSAGLVPLEQRQAVGSTDNSAPGLPQAGHVQELGVESKVLFIVYLKQS